MGTMYILLSLVSNDKCSFGRLQSIGADFLGATCRDVCGVEAKVLIVVMYS